MSATFPLAVTLARLSKNGVSHCNVRVPPAASQKTGGYNVQLVRIKISRRCVHRSEGEQYDTLRDFSLKLSKVVPGKMVYEMGRVRSWCSIHAANRSTVSGGWGDVPIADHAPVRGPTDKESTVVSASSKQVSDVSVPEGRYSAVERLVPGCTEGVVVNVDGSRVSSLVQDGVNGGGGVRRSDVGDHDVLNVVIEEEPRFLPAECFREWVEIAHGRDACVVVRHAANERLKSQFALQSHR
jgi:hypothetical protein